MTTKKLACYITVIGLSLTIHTTQTLCQNKSVTSVIKREPQGWSHLTKEEMDKKVKELQFHQRQERLKKDEPERKQRRLEAWMRLLRITAKQWNLIGPGYASILELSGVNGEEKRGAVGYGGGVQMDDWRSTKGFYWIKYASTPGSVAPTTDEMTEGQRVVDELIALLDDDNAKDQAIRQKIEALQEARAEARQAIPQAKQALRHTLTSRRQEAVFLLMGLID